MKLIIDIDKDYFEILKYEDRNGNDYKPIKLIANGTPLEELKKEEFQKGVANGYRMALQDLEIIKKEGEKDAN